MTLSRSTAHRLLSTRVAALVLAALRLNLHLPKAPTLPGVKQ